MAKKSSGAGRAGSPLPAAGLQTDDGAHGVTRPTAKPAKPSALLDTRFVYCGDNLEQLQKLPDACVDLINIDPPRQMQKAEVRMMKPTTSPILHSSFCLLPFPVTGSFYYHCDWHASHYVKVMLN